MGLFHSLAEGGQTWAHRIRMVRQVVKLAILFAIVIGVVYFVYQVWFLDAVYHQSFWYYWKATILGPFQSEIAVDADYWAKVARERRFVDQVLVHPDRVLKVIYPHYQTMQQKTYKFFTTAVMLSAWSFGGILLFFLLRGSVSSSKKHVSGGKIQSPRKVAMHLKLSRRASDIKLGALPLVKGTETQHILVSGGTGSGKTNCFHHILPQIRRRGQRAVVVDTTGDFVARYFRQGKDILMNPFDPKGVAWHPWIECRDRFDFESLAESFIPSTHDEREAYWRNAARTVLSSVLYKTKDARKTSLVTNILLHKPLADLCKFVQGTKACSHLDLNSEKTAGSVRSVATSYLDCLEYLEDTVEPFSIRNWVEKGTENDDSWLFITTNVAQRSALRPLVSSWLSIAIRSLLQLTPDLARRLWFVIDELPSLQKLKDFETFLTESRKFGGCALLALQSPIQLEMIYQWQAAKVILGNCLTKIAFYEHDPEVAEKISKAFGEREIIEFQEGISYGAHEMRDGVSLSGQTKMRPVVSANDILALEKHEAYVRLPGKVPVTKVKFGLVCHKVAIS